jgi:hypothetical protein
MMLLSENSILEFAREEVRRYRQKYIRSEHLLLALLRLDENLPIPYATLAARIEHLPYPTCGAEETLELAAGAKRILVQSYQHGQGELDSQTLFAAILDNSPLLRRIIREISKGV